MTHLADAETVHHNSVNSCLGDSLRRLQNNMQHVRRTREQNDGQFDAWLRQWSRRSDQIAKRLEMIDSQLDNMFEAAPAPPHFRVIESEER